LALGKLRVSQKNDFETKAERLYAIIFASRAAKPGAEKIVLCGYSVNGTKELLPDVSLMAV